MESTYSFYLRMENPMAGERTSILMEDTTKGHS